MVLLGSIVLSRRAEIKDKTAVRDKDSSEYELNKKVYQSTQT